MAANAKPSTSSSSSSSHHLNRSTLIIDLNQVPSPSETLPSPSSSTFILSPVALVRSIHAFPQLPEGAPAEIPDDPSFCGGCGRPSPDSFSDRLVCDACDRAFHFSCTGLLPSSRVPDDWLCRFCLADGVSSKRWRLGRKEDRGVRLFDMNSSPPSDGDAEALATVDAATAAAAAASSRNLCFGNNTSSGYASGGLMPYSNFNYPGNGFGFQKASTIVAHAVSLDFQDILHNKRSTARIVEDIKYGSQLGRVRSSGTTFRLPSWNTSEVLQSLREFISERHGVLDEGWRVEFKQSKNGCESYAVYCAPDGQVFETMSDVANYLGLASNGSFLQHEPRGDSVSTLRINGLHLPKRRKLTKTPVGNGSMENKDTVMSGRNNGFLSCLQKEQLLSKSEKVVEAPEVAQEKSGVDEFHQFHEALPLQYEDFFVLSLGKVDARTSYHDSCQIWPVGYRSCWHDKVTGSLFLCHVLEGGDTGPVFKVRRVSCSALPIPYGSTFLQRQHGICFNDSSKGSKEQTFPLEEESCIEMLLSDPSFPPEDSLSRLLSSSNEVDGQNIIQSNEVPSTSERSQDPSAQNLSTGDFGEFSVDGCSSSLVWSTVSQKIAEICLKLYKEKGCLKFFCKHVEDGMLSLNDIMTYENKHAFSSLDKFCSLLGSLKVPAVVKNDDEIDSTIEALKHWFSLDRFGLDVGFVQEFIEQCPDVRRCLQYESVRTRNDCLTAPLLQNGLLLINGKKMEQFSTVFHGLYKDSRTREEDCSSQSRPLGKALGVNLPPHLVGDAFQVWQLLSRFHEILGLESLIFEEFEAELKSPWFENISMLETCDSDSPGGQNVLADGPSTLSQSSGIVDPEENRFVEMQSTAAREETHVISVSCSRSECSRGLSLKRAHISLLDVLVSELQIKVAAMVDPSIDAESKSRRGRRKDVDSSILSIRSKLNLLPINELTWPELARRYILAVLSMDGNLDFAETSIRECGKILRCLQGDGGVLCGSLVGVAGIEADALLLAEAKKQIYGGQSSENDYLIIEEDDAEPVGTSEGTGNVDGNIPEWAQVLQPVRKLPTNVGTRIRKCVYEALSKDPPDWARKILEHSISKEVYKGNASGPTKKAVLSVLADVISEGSQQKTPKERKKQTKVSISDTIMWKCRILLRRAASADDEKIFCNLVGRNLIHSSDNDDEGLLGSPGMVSRPLDFRTIDLRLAFGAYSGSHEAFFEDVQELWNNIRVAHAEQPELVQLAERLSENFELLYEEEVVDLAKKLKEYSEMKQISSERKELKDILASTSDIPKAPWDEGVCKVCGIDKDDDSVLLCDTCDAEYHTYCLSPPLARIPEGNWYCPTCVSGINVLEQTSKRVTMIGQRHRRKNHGVGIRYYLEELTRLASVIEQKEYWEFNVDEKILLLKFLCDEVLNSILIRQHLEQCFETSSDLHQKLRMLYSELKNVKLREDSLAAAGAKSIPNVPTMAGNAIIEGNVGTVTNHSVCTEIKHESDCILSITDAAPQAKLDVGTQLFSNQNKCQNAIHLDRVNSNNSRFKQPVDSELHVKDLVGTVNVSNATCENNDLHERSSKRHKSSSFQDCSVLNTVLPEASVIDSKAAYQGRFDDLQETAISQEIVTDGIAETVMHSTSKQSSNLERDVLQKELSVLQQSIVDAESQLMKSSVRVEFLGSDSSGRFYWALAQPGVHPRVIVDGTLALQRRSEIDLRLEGSSAGCPFGNGLDHSHPSCSQWFYYQSEDEIRELVKSLRLSNQKERELKDSILNWQKLRCHGLQQTAGQDRILSSVSTPTEENESPGVVTRAQTLLEHKYGPFCQIGSLDDVKKRLRRSRGTSDEKLYRCRCFEPIWPSRHHCLTCHKTFYSKEKLEHHNNGQCKSRSAISGQRKESDEQSTDNISGKIEGRQNVSMAKDKVQAAKNADSNLSKYVKFQIEGSRCPHNFEEISTKFVTNDSIKELVHGIGLIGSEGTPSLVPFLSPYLNDPALRVVGGKCDNAAAVDKSKVSEQTVGQTSEFTGISCSSDVVDSGTHRYLGKEPEEISETGNVRGMPHERLKKGHASNFASSSFTHPYSMVPEASLKPVLGRANHILRKLKICLLDMEAALPEEALRPSKVHPEKRRAWHSFVKASETIFEMVQATIVLEDMIKAEYLKTERWYWSSLSAASKISTMSSLALRIYALDSAIMYTRSASDIISGGNVKSGADVDQQSPSNMDSSERSKQGRRVSTRRKRDAEG